jgi:hypothetical protein
VGELYLPKAFALDPQRSAEAGVPPERAGHVISLQMCGIGPPARRWGVRAGPRLKVLL